MLIISITFTAGRYHGTPWDAHVNEGRVEWPPSPWRFTRALLAVGHAKLGWHGSVPLEAQALVAACAGGLPSYRLPAGAESHVRHYMPLGVFKNGLPDKTKVFDAFFRLEDPSEPLLVAWPSLGEEHRELLAQLAKSLAYLGRAESWVEAKVLSAEEAQAIGAISPETGWCVPGAVSGAETLRLPAPMEPGTCAAALAAVAAQAAPKLKKRIPIDLLACLHLETSQWQKDGWSTPPGLRWVEYAKPREVACHGPAARGTHRLQADATAEAVLLSLFGDGKKGTVLPLLSRSLPLGESLHAAAARSGHPQLTGCTAERQRADDHRHAHFIPLCLGDSHRVDHVLAWSGDKEKPFDAAALRALAGVPRAYAKDIENLVVRVAGQGGVKDIVAQLGAGQGPYLPEGLWPMQSGCLWESRTPFVLRQFANRGYRRPEAQVRAELEARGFDNLETIEFLPWQTTAETSLRNFVILRRPGKPQPPMERRWFVRLRFAVPQDGPVCLGYGSHFGLGSFACTDGHRW